MAGGARHRRKYTLDANLFIEGMRTTVGAARLAEFHTLFAPYEYLSAVVVQELRAGFKTTEAVARFEASVVDPFRRRGRLVIPSFAAWQASGAVLATLVAEDHLELKKVSKRKVNDILLALSCREAGITLVTENVSDFERINAVTAINFVPPWPSA
ncbi:MAG TPA: type II toxin-antitoxin system VapC family toxin [Gemmatimonadaceae bacterium]|jgi:predicted nucleic acid-binding protein|nr:type II toxin-antitoxin system VapC family toxin [Gemmatimonadaceae bacterium]